jgi:hypothetical protein
MPLPPPADRRPRRRSGHRATEYAPGLSRYGTLVVFLLLVLFNIAVTPNFLAWNTLILNLTQVATVVIVAMGMTLVIATGGIDLSVGSTMAIAGALAPLIFLGNRSDRQPCAADRRLPSSFPVLAAAACGWFNGMLITRYSHPADRRDAGAVHRRARHCPDLHQQPVADLQRAELPVHRQGRSLRHPGAGGDHDRGGDCHRLPHPPHRDGPPDPRCRRQPESGAAFRHQRLGSSASSMLSAAHWPASPD